MWSLNFTTSPPPPLVDVQNVAPQRKCNYRCTQAFSLQIQTYPNPEHTQESENRKKYQPTNCILLYSNMYTTLNHNYFLGQMAQY